MKSSPSKGAKAGAGAEKKRSRSEAVGFAWDSSPPTSPPRPNPNKEWKKSKVTTEDLLALVNSGFFWEKEMDMWRTAAGGPYPATLALNLESMRRTEQWMKVRDGTLE
jgi:hypothetical protein